MPPARLATDESPKGARPMRKSTSACWLGAQVARCVRIRCPLEDVEAGRCCQRTSGREAQRAEACSGSEGEDSQHEKGRGPCRQHRRLAPTPANLMAYI